MKIIEETHPLSDFTDATPYFSEESLFLDIETTGFDAKRQPVYLIGTAYRKEDHLKVVLCFAETPDAEAEILQAFLDRLPNYREIITFNGEGFDIPYLQKRCELHHLISPTHNDNKPTNISHNNRKQASEADVKQDNHKPSTSAASLIDTYALTSIDLLKSVRSHKKLLHLDRCNQKSVETSLNIERENTYDGGQLIEVYRRYAKQPNETDEHLLLRHNLDDVCGMVRLLPMLAYDALQNADFTVENADWDKDASLLTLTLSMNVTLPKPVRIHENAYYFILEENRLKAALPFVHGELRYFFPYPAQYVYLPREGSVIPKVLASSIPSAEKRPATQEECFSTVAGDFLAVDRTVCRKHPTFFEGEKLFQKQWGDDLYYIKTDPQATDMQNICDYVSLLLHQHL